MEGELLLPLRLPQCHCHQAQFQRGWHHAAILPVLKHRISDLYSPPFSSFRPRSSKMSGSFTDFLGLISTGQTVDLDDSFLPLLTYSQEAAGKTEGRTWKNTGGMVRNMRREK